LSTPRQIFTELLDSCIADTTLTSLLFQLRSTDRELQQQAYPRFVGRILGPPAFLDS